MSNWMPSLTATQVEGEKAITFNNLYMAAPSPQLQSWLCASITNDKNGCSGCSTARTTLAVLWLHKLPELPWLLFGCIGCQQLPIIHNIHNIYTIYWTSHLSIFFAANCGTQLTLTPSLMAASWTLNRVWIRYQITNLTLCYLFVYIT